jgi:hypothetical protein
MVLKDLGSNIFVIIDIIKCLTQCIYEKKKNPNLAPKKTNQKNLKLYKPQALPILKEKK